jgi:hypothetical protein
MCPSRTVTPATDLVIPLFGKTVEVVGQALVSRLVPQALCMPSYPPAGDPMCQLHVPLCIASWRATAKAVAPSAHHIHISPVADKITTICAGRVQYCTVTRNSSHHLLHARS